MHIVTGGAGFIGSNVAAALCERGDEVVVCDWLGSDERWRNLRKHDIVEIIAPEILLSWLDRSADAVQSIIHMGAISATTETNVDLIVERNIRASCRLLDWCTRHQIPLIYASSAATYGDGRNDFDDLSTPAALAQLRPLNAYGWSKHAFDRRIARLAASALELPPQWVGLKFFNVYGPNEYHKGAMRSLVAKSYVSVRDGQPLSLFKSGRPEFPDGGQQRDFVYVQDCVDVILWLLDHPKVSGLFNLGTGIARSWNELANALFEAIKRPTAIEYQAMPAELAPSYQYHTQARMERLRAAGYSRPFTVLEDGIGQYAHSYLSSEDPYR